MRTNTFGNRTTLRRDGFNHIPAECRKCKLRPESLSHVLGGCVSQKASVIRRHNEVGKIVAGKYAQRFPQATLLYEPSLTLASGERLKPDLVIRNQEGVHVVDFTVRYEDGDALQRAVREKREKYEGLKDVLLERLGGSNFAVHAIVLGARGAVPRATQGALRALSIWSRDLGLTLSLTALRSSIEMANTFLDD